MDTNLLFSATVLVNGRRLREYEHIGKTFVEAKEGSEFTINIRNHHSLKVLAVVSVDGIGVIDGKPAGENSAGYIIPAHSSIDVKGWRVDENNVGAFKFTKANESYSESLGLKGNQGVIGVMFFLEKQEFYNFEAKKSILTRSLPTTLNTVDFSLSASSFERDIGTTWGSQKNDACQEVEFKRGQKLKTLEIFYASKAALIKFGVPIEEKAKINFPKSFPASFAKPPEGWNQMKGWKS